MKLSIITPSYNQGKFIEKTLQSILEQKLDFDLEYILIDAVSSDETDSIVKKLESQFKKKGINFIYKREKDNGQSDAINKGFELATGDIITYINSDDFYQPNVLSKVVIFFKNNPKIKWAYGGWNFVKEKGEQYKAVKPKKFNYADLLNYCNIGQPSCFFKKNLLKEMGNLKEDLHLTMDYELWLRFATKYNPGIVPFIISNMRYHSEAKSGSQTLKHLKETLKTNTNYTTPFSWRRFCQYFYFLRGYLIIILGKDITKRINK
jgi:glycosyltransferase involved in cell wall biosynthesis